VRLTPPHGPQWVHEIKHDGYRLIVCLLLLASTTVQAADNLGTFECSGRVEIRKGSSGKVEHKQLLDNRGVVFNFTTGRVLGLWSDPVKIVGWDEQSIKFEGSYKDEYRDQTVSGELDRVTGSLTMVEHWRNPKEEGSLLDIFTYTMDCRPARRML
jgi:hypothetical protein